MQATCKSLATTDNYYYKEFSNAYGFLLRDGSTIAKRLVVDINSIAAPYTVTHHLGDGQWAH
jgi:hypothetical protein